MSTFKRLAAMLLAMVMVAALVPPVTVSAAEAEEPVRVLTMETKEEVVYLEEFAEQDLIWDYNPELAPGNHVRWIDRLANLPGYAWDLYNWFVENSDNDGVDDDLIDVSGAAFVDEDGWLLQPITTISGSAVLDVPANADDYTLSNAAANALEHTIQAEKEKVYALSYAVVTAFVRDNPGVFWWSGYNSCVPFIGRWVEYENGQWVASFEMDIYYILQDNESDWRDEKYWDVNFLRSTIAQRDSSVSQILAGMPANGSRLEKIIYLNDWLTMHNSYNTTPNLDYAPGDSFECISALTGRTGRDGPVCEAYSEAMMMLCTAAGIPCILVDSPEHMWNNVQMEDGNWYALDVTWNDPYVDDGAMVSGYENHDYLLVGGATVIDGEAFQGSHPATNWRYEEGTWFTNGPILSDVAYDGGSSEPAIPQLAAPANPIWGHEFNPNFNTPDPGMIAWNSAEPTQGVYEVKVYKVGNSEPVLACLCEFGTQQNWFVISDFKVSNPEDGDYYFTVTSVGDGVSYLSSEPATSSIWSYARPVEQLGICTDLGWGTFPDISVTLPENASLANAYNVLLFYAETIDEEPQWIGDAQMYIPESGILNCGYNEHHESFGDGYYYYKIRLLSGDTNAALNGEWSEMSPAYHLSTEVEEPEQLSEVTGSWTTDLVMSAADLGVSAPDSVLRATMTFREDGTCTTTWEAVDLTAFRIFFHDMFVNAYYAMAYGAGITDLAQIEQFCIDSTGMGVSAYMDTLVTDEAMVQSFTPASTSGQYMYNADHSAIYTTMSIMDVRSNPETANSFVIGGNTMYLNAASYGKPDYTFVCNRVG